MKDKTIDYALRATWQAVSRMYNEEAGKHTSTMATGFTLLSIDPDSGTPSTSLGPRMGMEATSFITYFKINWKTEDLYFEKKILMMVVVS